MKRNAIIYALWPINIKVIENFIGNNEGVTILSLPDFIPKEVEKIFIKNGCEIVYLSDLLPKLQTDYFMLESSTLVRYFENKYIESNFTKDLERVQRCTQTAITIVNYLAVLNYALEHYVICFGIINEQYTPIAKMISLFLQKNNISNIYLSHGAALGVAYTIHDVFHADIYCVGSAREQNGNNNVNKSRKKVFKITGLPSWDKLYIDSTNIHKLAWFKKYQIDEELPTVTLFTAWNADVSKLFRLEDEYVLEPFKLVFQAKKNLEALVGFNLIIKDRPGGNHKNRVVNLAKDLGLNNFFYMNGDADPFLQYSDLIISLDSSISVEAIIASNAPLNIPRPIGWYYGPYIGGNDGIINLNSDNIEETIATFLIQPKKRQEYIDSLRNTPQYYSPAFEGKATESVVVVMNEFMPLENSEAIKQYQLDNLQEAQQFEESGIETERPLISFVMKVVEEQKDFLVTTINSLCAQINSHWQLLVVADFEVFDTAFEQHENLHWVYMRSEDFVDRGLDDAVNCLEEGWLCFLKPGMEVEPYFLTYCLHYIASCTRWQFIYMDEGKVNQYGDYCLLHRRPNFDESLLGGRFDFGENCLVELSVLKHIIAESRTHSGIESFDWLLRVFKLFGTASIGHISDILVSSNNLVFESKNKQEKSIELWGGFSESNFL